MTSQSDRRYTEMCHWFHLYLQLSQQDHCFYWISICIFFPSAAIRSCYFSALVPFTTHSFLPGHDLPWKETGIFHRACINYVEKNMLGITFSWKWAGAWEMCGICIDTYKPMCVLGGGLSFSTSVSASHPSLSLWFDNCKGWLLSASSNNRRRITASPG